MGIKYLNLSTIKDEKSAAKFHYIKTVSGKVVAQLIAFRVVSIYWHGVAPFLAVWTQRDWPPLEAPALHTLGLIARQPWRHCVTSLRSATGQPVSRTQASDAITSRLLRYEAKCVQRRRFQCESIPCVQISREQSYPQPIYWYHSKGNGLRYNFAAESFYIMKLFSRLFVLYCRNCPKHDKFRYFIPILRKLGAA